MTEEERQEMERLWRRHRLIVRLGQVVMVAGVIVLVTHWLTHIEVFGKEQPGLLIDLAVGYPMGAVLLIVGAIVASHKQPTAR